MLRSEALVLWTGHASLELLRQTPYSVQLILLLGTRAYGGLDVLSQVAKWLIRCDRVALCLPNTSYLILKSAPQALSP